MPQKASNHTPKRRRDIRHEASSKGRFQRAGFEKGTFRGVLASSHGDTRLLVLGSLAEKQSGTVGPLFGAKRSLPFYAKVSKPRN